MHPISRRATRLELRELALDDVDAVHAIYGSATATEHLSFEPRTRDEVHAITRRSLASAVACPREEYALAVVRRDGGELIGFGRLALDPHQPRAATVGFALRPDTWGAGYGSESLRLLLNVGFGPLRLHRIWGARSPLNEASARTMARVGMVEEGRIREHVHKGGVWRDSIVHSVLDHEWTRLAGRGR
ncbi:GNAT family protein [Streptomyces crystallinus]|uniref:GNAT family protein n=1 Tax=Streptomyces crystallinus TaxID=68191 RepID=A0ABP3RYP2_9ACTN